MATKKEAAEEEDKSFLMDYIVQLLEEIRDSLKNIELK